MINGAANSNLAPEAKLLGTGAKGGQGCRFGLFCTIILAFWGCLVPKVLPAQFIGIPDKEGVAEW